MLRLFQLWSTAQVDLFASCQTITSPPLRFFRTGHPLVAAAALDALFQPWTGLPLTPSLHTTAQKNTGDQGESGGRGHGQAG